MNLIKCEKLEKSMAELQFSIDAEAFKKAVADVFKKEGKKYPVQGFRKGKAPKALIEKMYGADVFTYDAINELFPEAFEAAAKEAGVEPVGRPEVTVDSASEAEGATLTVKVAVKPEIKVGSYNGLTVEKTVHTVTDEAVDAELKRVQERNARELTREGAAQNGDIADIDFEGFVDGVAFEGGKAEHYNLTLGSGSFIPGFEEQVVGHSAGEEFDVNVTFPTEYQAAELAGKAAVFKIKLHEVKYKELPALDDELAKDCSEYDTLDEFKASIRKNNQEQLDKQDDLAVENALVDQVIESMEGEIPQAMYDVRMDEMVNDFAFRVEQQGLRLEDYLKYMGQSMEQFRAAFMPQAEKQVKIGLALEAVAAAEHIEASEDEINAEIKRIADQYKMEEDKVRELINLEDLKQDLASMKLTMYMMPLMYLFFCFTYPLAFSLYYVISNIVMTAQTQVMRKFYDPEKMRKEVEAEIAAKRKQEKRGVKNTTITVTDPKTGKSVEKNLSASEMNKRRLEYARQLDAERYKDERTVPLSELDKQDKQ